MPRGLTTGIIYIPLDVRWPRSKKVRALIVRHGEQGMAAWALYLAMVCYCRENLSDGFVPVEEAGAMAYPLPPDRAGHLLTLLEDYRLIGPADGQGSSNGHSQGLSDGLDTRLSDRLSDRLDTGLSQGYIVRAYLKRNPSRADALKTAENLAKAGRAGGRTRSSQWAGSDGLGTGLSDRLDTRVPQTETETKTPRARAGTRPREAGWTPHSALDHQPGRRGPRPDAARAAEVQAAARRPGGPADDVHGWAAKARAGITDPDQPSPGDRQEPLPEPAQPPARQDQPEPDREPEEPETDDIPF